MMMIILNAKITANQPRINKSPLLIVAKDESRDGVWSFGKEQKSESQRLSFNKETVLLPAPKQSML